MISNALGPKDIEQGLVGEKLQSRFGIISTAIVFVFALSINYIFDISKYWEYAGFAFEFNVYRLLVSILILIFTGYLIERSLTVVSFYQQIAYFSLLCPSFVLYFLGRASNIFLLITSIAVTVLFFASRILTPNISIGKLSEKAFILIMSMLTIFTILAILSFGGWKYFNLDLLSVYEFRRDAAAALPQIFGYLNSAVAKVAIPIGIVFGLAYRSKLTVAIFLFFSVIFFGLTQHKSTLATPILTIVLYLFILNFGIGRALKILFLLAATVMIAEVIYGLSAKSNSSGVFSSFIVRRVLFVPSLLNGYYVSFFSENPLIYWSDSRISFGKIDRYYDMTAPFLIGEKYFGNSNTSANAGFVGSGFANYGIYGVAIYATAIGILIGLLNSYGQKVGHVIVICSSLTVIISALISSDFVTIFLTHGLVFLLFSLSLMPKRVD